MPDANNEQPIDPELPSDEQVIKEPEVSSTPEEAIETVSEDTPEPETEPESEVVEAVAEDQPEATIPVTPMPITVAPKPKKKVLLVVLLSVLLLAAVVAAWFLVIKKDDTASNTETTQTTVKKLGVAVGLIEGKAEYSSDGENWQALATDTDLSEGDSVRTDASSRLVLLIDDGSALRVGASSSAKLTNLSIDKVIITNLSGELYNRVVASISRAYEVAVGDENYQAKGTAYRTFNTEAKKGVEVFQSTVSVDSKDTDVPEGSSFFSLNAVKTKEGQVSAIDIEELKKDDFIKWNSEQDKKTAEFSDKLGMLGELDKPAPAPVAAPKPATSAPAGITLSGKVSEYSAVFSWAVKGVDTSKGFKLVKSKTSQTPTYPENSAAYIEAGKTSYSLYLGDGKTYYFRICAYRGDSCDSYSNTVTITTPVKPVEPVVHGTVDLTISGNTASWVLTGGNAPHGFKIVISESPNTPSYGDSLKKLYSSSSPYEISGLSAGTYNVRVCKYTNSSVDGGCTDYSDQEVYVVP